jgi:tetratricopeptide (TPR) repeat protein
MLGEDRADILQIDGSSPNEKTAKSSSGKKDKSDDVVILGYDGDSAGGVATKPAKKQKAESTVPTHLHCLKEVCRFFQKKDGECKFDSIFDEIKTQSGKIDTLEKQTKAIEEVGRQTEKIGNIEQQLKKIDSIEDAVSNTDSVSAILDKITAVEKQIQDSAKAKGDNETEKSTTKVTKELDKFWKFQTKSVSEMIASIGEAEKKQEQSFSAFQKEMLKSTKDKRPAIDPKTIDEIREQMQTLQAAVELREDGIENFSTTISELVMNLDDTLKIVQEKSETLADRIAGLESSFPKFDEIQNGIQNTLNDKLDQAKAPDLSKEVGAINSRFDEVLDAHKNIEKHIDEWRNGMESRIKELREQQDSWKENLGRIEDKQSEMIKLVEKDVVRLETETTGYKKKEAKKFNNLGVTSFHNGELELARDQFLEAVTLDARFAEAWNNLGLVYTELQDDEEATRAFSKTVEINPDLPAAYNNLGYIFYKQGSYDQAVEMYNEALGRSSDNGSAYTNLGNAYFKQGNLDDARSAWEKALEIDPGNEKASRNLKRLDKE